jgi:hypothetical protein
MGLSVRSARHRFPESIPPLAIELPGRLKKVDIELSTVLAHRAGFREIRGLDSLIYREDIANLEAWTFALGIQRRQERQHTRHHQTVGLGYRHSRFIGERWLSSTLVDLDWRFDTGSLKEHTSTAFHHLYYLPSERQAWVGGLTWQYAYARDELSEPLTMGGNVGLRGYEEGAFSGNKTLLLNLEHRLRFSSPWQSIGLGQALFVDAGYAWDRKDAPRADDLRVNFGWGLRIDIPSLFGDDILRFDVAMDSQNGEVLATLTLGQVFRYDALADNTTRDF